MLIGLSFWSVVRKHSWPAASFCWLRSVMLVAVTLVQFWAAAGRAQKNRTAIKAVFFMETPI
jgi:hypothetical protein